MDQAVVEIFKIVMVKVKTIFKTGCTISLCLMQNICKNCSNL